MAYIVAADFRAATAKHWTSSLHLEVSDISDTDLTALIASRSALCDRYTGDHFEPETGSAISVVADAGTDTFTATAHGLSNGWQVIVGGVAVPSPLVAGTVYYVISAAANTFQLSATSGGTFINLTTTGTTVTVTSYTTTLYCDGEDQTALWLPKRVRAVAAVSAIFPGGSAVTVATSSFTSEWFTGDYSQITHASKLVFYPGLYVWPGGWPGGTANVIVQGSFGWPTTPDEIKRAIALMVWDMAFPEADILARSQPAGFNSPASTPTGIPEADAICSFFERRCYA